MPVSKDEKTEPIKVEEKPEIKVNNTVLIKNIEENVAALERKIAAIFNGMLEFKQDLKKIKSRLGL